LTHWWRRPYRLLEDGRYVGPQTELVDNTRARGHGRFTVWRGSIWLSATDGSDPKSNGRAYEVERPINVPLWAMLGLLALTGAGLLAAPGETLRGKVQSATRLNLGSGVTAVTAAAVLFWAPWKMILAPTASAYISIALILAMGLFVPRLRVALSARFVIFTVAAVFAVLLATRIPDPIAGGGCVFEDRALRIVGIACAVAAYWRPSLAIIPAIAFIWTQRILTEAYQGLPVDGTGDWLPLSDCVVFLVALLTKVHTARRVAGFDPLPRHVCDALVLIAAAPHLAIYAHSGFEKILLDGGPLSWVAENKTYWLAVNSQALGVSPMGSSHWLMDWVVDWMQTLNVPLNLLTLASQVAATGALLFPPFAAVLCLIVDVWHVGIAALTGIVFWKWMALNLAFAAAFQRMGTTIPIQVRVAAVGLLILAPNMFTIIALGCYDTPAINVIRGLRANG
jgi:hypothetical protein